MKLSHRKSLIIPFVVMCCYFTAAWYNLGYFHPDEHYQLIEFAGLKLGWNAAEDLAWEYGELIRPTLQVWLCVVWFKLMGVFGLHDPYVLAFSLRLLSAGLALMSIRFFISNSRHLFKPSFRVPYELLSYFLWFVPLVSVRFSSETWSGLSFLIALGWVMRPGLLDDRKYYWIGFLLALSFLFRFQAGLLIVPLLLWMIAVKRDHWRSIFTIVIVMTLTIQGGMLLDAGFYGTYTLTFWNYFRVNILQDAASNFGVSPWTEVLTYLWEYPLWPVGTVIVLAMVVLLIRKPTSVFLWCLIPFIAVHAWIPHKEVRFLFPVVYLVPAIIMLAIQEVGGWWAQGCKTKLFFNLALVPFVLSNLFMLVMVLFRPAGRGQKHLTQFIVESYTDRPIQLFHTRFGNPFQPWSGLSERFYETDSINYRAVKLPSDLNGLHLSQDTVYLLACRKNEETEFLHELSQRGMWSVSLEARSIPRWIDQWSNWYAGANDWTYGRLYLLKNK